MSSDLQSFVGGKYTPYPVKRIARRDRYGNGEKTNSRDTFNSWGQIHLYQR